MSLRNMLKNLSPKSKIKKTANTNTNTHSHSNEEIGEEHKHATVPNQSASQSQSVPWHDFTVKELLQLSKQNAWTDVSTELSSVIISLSTYNPPNTKQIAIQSQPNNSSVDPDTDNKIASTSSKTKTTAKSDSNSNEDDDEKDNNNNSNNIASEQHEQQQQQRQQKRTLLLNTLKEDFYCDICLDIYIEPLTLGCGHTFCRICVMQIQSKCEKKCPLCKAVCHLNAFLHSPNILIAKCTANLFPAEYYKQRVLELEKQKKQLLRNIPTFIMNMVRFPGQRLNLHLFEPRYKHMINRAISSGKRFAYVCRSINDTIANSAGGRTRNHNRSYQPYCNDIALLVYVKECQFLADGRCYIVGVCEKRVLVSSMWIEKGTQGLWYIKYTDYDDKALFTAATATTMEQNNNHSDGIDMNHDDDVHAEEEEENESGDVHNNHNIGGTNDAVNDERVSANMISNADEDSFVEHDGNSNSDANDADVNTAVVDVDIDIEEDNVEVEIEIEIEIEIKIEIEKHWISLLNEFIDVMHNQSRAMNASIERECGERQHLNVHNMDADQNGSRWSFYVCGLMVEFLGTSAVSKAFLGNAFKGLNYAERIQSCYDILKSNIHKWKPSTSSGSTDV